MISNLEQIKQVPIADVIGRAKIGKGNMLCCPLHGEKTPSMKVNEKKNFFKCFGCGESGDAIGYLQKLYAYDFITAVEEVAKIGGIEIEVSQDFREKYKKNNEEKKSIKECMTWAMKHYSSMLHMSESGKSYLEKRMITDESVAIFQIGFAPNSWSYLSDMITGITTPEHAKRIGLINEKDKGGFYDCFRNRIVLPYQHHFTGEPISLAARKIDDSNPNEPKTLKGKNTDIFQNENYLYGYYQAYPHIKKEGFAIIVEGEIDVIMMHQAGAKNTIGRGNNRIKEEQLKFLKSQGIQTLVFVPDHDVKDNGRNPGFEGFEHDLSMALSYGFRCDIYELPPSNDPDDFAKEFIINNIKSEKDDN